MTSGIYFPLCCLFFSLQLMFVYFSKKRLDNLENKIYKVLVVLNFVGLIIEILCYFYIRNSIPFTSNFILRLYLVYLCAFIGVFTDYISVITYKSKHGDENLDKFFNIISTITLILIALEILLIFILPMEIFNDNNIVAYTYGPAVNFVYVVALISIGIWFFNLAINFKNIKNKKYLPMFIFLFIGTFATVFQYFNPAMLLMTSMETLICSLMFHTIENPDIILLRAIANKKDEANRINNDKAMFLFNMSQDIKKPVMDIQVKCENALMGETVDEFKDGIRSIKESANQASRLINASLNISEASSANLKLVNKKYSTALLFKEIVEMTKAKLKDKEVEFRYNIDDSIPEYLMGDSLRFKQMVAIILNNAIKHTEKGYIELDVSHVIKVDVCSFIINVIDTGKGMSQEKLNEALNSSKEVTGSDEDIATSKTLAGLSNGTIMGVSEEGKGSKFTIIVNQKIAREEENSSIERSVLKVDSDKKILVVENDEKEQNKIIKLLKDENISIEITNMGVGCLEKIRNGSHYDLIIINEELPKLSGIMTYQKLKIINNFNIPVIMMIDKSHEEYIEKYLDLGIKKCLIKQEKKTTKDNILEVLRKD